MKERPLLELLNLVEAVEHYRATRPATASYLAQTRERAGVTQRSLASTIGVSQPFLSQIENGYVTPSPTIVRAYIALEGEGRKPHGKDTGESRKRKARKEEGRQ